MSDVPGKTAKAEGVRFGSAVVKLRKADSGEFAKHVAIGQAALARAMRALQNPGTKLTRIKGIALYAADPERPDRLIRKLDGQHDRGVFDNDEFKVTG